MLKTRSEDSARSTQLDAEFKRKVERLLKSDHDDEIDLFPDILAVKKAEDAKARFIEQYGSKLKGRAIRNCNSNYRKVYFRCQKDTKFPKKVIQIGPKFRENVLEPTGKLVRKLDGCASFLCAPL